MALALVPAGPCQPPDPFRSPPDARGRRRPRAHSRVRGRTGGARGGDRGHLARRAAFAVRARIFIEIAAREAPLDPAHGPDAAAQMSHDFRQGQAPAPTSEGATVLLIMTLHAGLGGFPSSAPRADPSRRASALPPLRAAAPAAALPLLCPVHDVHDPRRLTPSHLNGLRQAQSGSRGVPPRGPATRPLLLPRPHYRGRPHLVGRASLVGLCGLRALRRLSLDVFLEGLVPIRARAL